MYDFNANDIFEIAEQLERNGAKFYRAAAESVGDQSAKTFLLKLADMEDGHEKTFAQMRSALTADEKTATVFDPDGEAVGYLQALADTRVFFEKELDVSSMEAILKDAVTAEKDSIVFYLGMRDAVPENKGRGRLDAIIKEEMGHIQLLSKELKALTDTWSTAY
jgi:rubrerythrin